jgi:hypothetical protein
MTPYISVIMPCLTSAAHVRTSVASALAQTFSDMELIVVDNGSVDHTVSVVRSVDDSGIRLLREARREVSAARNLSMAAARGRFIAFLDFDDNCALVCLAKLCSALYSESDAVLAYYGWQNIGLSGPRGEPFVLADGEFECYWRRDLQGARILFTKQRREQESTRNTAGISALLQQQ